MPASAYARSGVDRDRGEYAKELIKNHVRSTFTKGVVGDVGFFGGCFQVKGYRNPVLVSSTDGVGTKLKLATYLGRFDTVGIDLVNHCVNDIFVCGADPLFFLDYMGFGRIDPVQTEQLVKGMARACKDAGCALIGGETAELPGLYREGDFDLVGFIVGAVERARLITGQRIAEGDMLLGIPSSGLHTNGYSLARRAFGVDDNPAILNKRFPELGATLGDVLLKPHRSYYPVLKPHLKLIKGMAHITGGGFYDNIPRVLPKGLGAEVRATSWHTPPIYRLIQRRANVAAPEMYRVFNMGIGMVVICSPTTATALQKQVPDAVAIGHVTKARRGPRLVIM
ncbi:MAG: phosphoribosylformylglycinamidine cyclo-ligase [Chloroflexi bacterium]|nr:phosphoribosylformylglycinamidine cyclo-ligase [Chloroflexota bacterium]